MQLFASRQIAQRNWLGRRTFLKAVALGLSAPLAFKMSRLAVAQPSTRPSRLFIFFLPHGAPAEHYEVGEGMALDASGVGVLSPLAPYTQYLTVLRGVGNLVSSNHEAVPTVLTGKRDSNSIDYEIAKALGVPAHVLGVNNFWPGSTTLGQDAQLVNHGGYVSPIQSPYDALEDLFAGLTSGETPPEAEVNEVAFRSEAIDLTIGELEAMQTALADLTTERNKLGIHLESLRALKESSGPGGVVSCDTRPSLPAAEATQGIDVAANANLGLVLDGHLEAAAHALLCGSARVVTLQNMYANAQIPMDFAGGPGIAKNHHDPLSHSFDAAGRAEFATVQKWFYSRLAEKFLAVLDVPDPQDPEHTVLDNTTILTCTEISDGQNHHSDSREMWLNGAPMASYLPWVILGKGSGLFRGNQVARFENLDHRNILAAVAESMGVPLTSFGGADVATPAELKA